MLCTVKIKMSLSILCTGYLVKIMQQAVTVWFINNLYVYYVIQPSATSWSNVKSLFC